MSGPYLLSIDQGTTSTRAMVFDAKGKPVAKVQHDLPQCYPHSGWVEHDPEQIWQAVLACCCEVLAQGFEIAGIGITNQRETTIIWDTHTGKPVYNAIVWQDRRTAKFCDDLKTAGHETMIQSKTGLLLDPYFSASKIHWLLQHIDGAYDKAQKGELAFGTIDSFILWRLTGGKVHATDATNASRTLLFNIHTQTWDDELLALFDIPRAILPEVKDCAANYGMTAPDLFEKAMPIAAIVGDQQAATIGQACFQHGMLKSTYGTGGFLVLNTGDQAVQSHNRLLTTVAYRLNGKVTYALEGSIFIAGAVVQWLRDNCHFFQFAKESEVLARSVDSNGGVTFIPAFTGLGAPYWHPGARGAIVGLSRQTSIAEITRAALEAVCFQTQDIMNCLREDLGNSDFQALQEVRVDGGMVENNFLCQTLADVLNMRVERTQILETTARGVAFLAGLQCGIYQDLSHIADLWKSDQSFLAAQDYTEAYALWQRNVQRLLD